MLKQEYRLQKSRDFKHAYSRGRVAVNELMVLHSIKRTKEPEHGIRVGFVVSKKQGGSVVRNRIRRRLREAVREILIDMPATPIDLVFVGRAKVNSASWDQVFEGVKNLLTKAGVVRGEKA